MLSLSVSAFFARIDVAQVGAPVQALLLPPHGGKPTSKVTASIKFLEIVQYPGHIPFTGACAQSNVNLHQTEQRKSYAIDTRRHLFSVEHWPHRTFFL